MHGNAVRPKGYGLLFVQKSVDGHTPLLELLNHQRDGFGGDVGVGKIVFDLQLIPGKGVLQGRTKAPAQR